jgi:hypothetical protein
MNPEPKSARQYPKEMRKKRDPASSCPIFNSNSIVGIRGDRMILERKFKRKISTRNTSDPTWERKEAMIFYQDLESLMRRFSSQGIDR